MSQVKILLVKDRVSENTDITNFLIDWGYEVSNVTSNFEEFYGENSSFDLILVDTSLVKLDVELVSKIDELNIPIIFIIQPSEESEIEQLNLIQPYDKLKRPFTQREIKYAVEFLIYKNRTEKELNDKENKFILNFKNSPVPYQSLDSEGKIVDVNSVWLNILGYSKEEVIGKNFADFMTPEYSKNLDKNFRGFKEFDEINGMKFKIKKSGGSHLLVSYHGKNIYDESGAFKQTNGILQDITDKKYEEKIKQINHLHSTVNQIYQSILRIKNRDELFQTVCDEFVGYGKFEMAWVGLIDFKTGNVDPVAHAGNESGYLDVIPMNIYEAHLKFKPGLNTFNQGSWGIVGNIKTFKDCEWWEEASKRGYNSLISLPLIVKEQIIGIINIYSGKPDFFADEEIDLMSKIGVDLSFALKVMETEKKKKLAETALKNSEKEYRDLVDNSLIGIFKTNLKGEILYANSAVAKIFKYDTVEELKSHNIIDVYKYKEERLEFITKLKEKGKISRCERENIGKDGQTVHILSSASLDGDVISGMFMDITYRKQVEDKFHSIINNSADLFIIVDDNRRITFSSPSSQRIIGYSPEFLTGKDPCKFVHKDDVDIFKEHLDDVSKTLNTGLFTEFRVIKSDGDYLPVETVSQNMMNVSGINGIVITSHPIQERKEMEETLRKSEERYKTLFQLDPDYTLLLGLDGKIIDVNSAVEQFSGISKDEVVGKHFKELKVYDVEDECLHERMFAKLLKNGEIPPYESKIIDLDGGVHWVKTVFTTIKRNNVPIYYLIIATDVTELKNKEEALKENQRVLETLISNLPGVVYKCQNDPQWTMEFVSEGCYKLTGYHTEDMIMNRKISFNDLIHPDDQQRVWDNIQRSLDNKKPFKIIYKICTKDHKIKYVWEQGRGIFSNTGELLWLEGFITDVTRRIIDEEKIKESEIYYRTMFENTGTATLIIEKDKTISQLNTEAANLSGYSIDEIENKKKWTEFVEKNELKRLEDYFNLRRRSEFVPITYETKLVNKAGVVKDIFVNVACIPETDKELASILDITERKTAEKDLQASLKEKEVLLKEIHHRVKNNMQIVSSLLNLQTQYVDGYETQNVLRESQGRVKTMAMIHEKLYQSNDLTQIRFDDYIVKLVSDIFYSCDVKNDRIESVINLDEVNLNIETAIPCGLIINELISNSLKYAFPNDAKGKIGLSLKKSGKNYELIIFDDGIGFPESLDFRSTDSLGLQLVTNLVDQIDGQIELNTDHGTKFIIKFRELDYNERF